MTTKHSTWLLLAICLASAPSHAKDRFADSVVKIHATQREADYIRPWNKGNSQETAGSGVVIEGKRILTNAHVVLHANQLFVQANQSTERVPAKVLAVAPGIDLAVVQPESPSFFDQRCRCRWQGFLESSRR